MNTASTMHFNLNHKHSTCWLSSPSLSLHPAVERLRAEFPPGVPTTHWGSDRTFYQRSAWALVPLQRVVPLPAASRHFYLEFRPSGPLRITTPTCLCFCKKSRPKPGGDDKFTVGWCDQQAFGESLARKEETQHRMAKGSYLRFWASRLCSLIIHLVIPDGRDLVVLPTQTDRKYVSWYSSAVENPRSRLVCSSRA